MTCRVETGPGWELRCGDCLDPETGLASLGDRSVDHVITDPPYEAEAHTLARRIGKGGRGLTAGSVAYVIDFGAITGDIRSSVARQSARVGRGWVLAFCQVEAVGEWRGALVQAGGRWARGMAWVKPCSAPQFTGDRPGMGHESIAVAWVGVGRMRWNGGGKHGVYVEPIPQARGGERLHPTLKPLPLMLALVSDFTDPGELIADPFAGSGTTGVACIRLGRRFIGWEREPKYFDVAVKRLRAAREQLRMTLDVEPMGEQADLLSAPLLAAGEGD